MPVLLREGLKYSQPRHTGESAQFLGKGLRPRGC